MTRLHVTSLFLYLTIQCHLYRGVHPLFYNLEVKGNWFEDVDQRLLAGIDKGKRDGYISKGSTIVLLSGWRPGPSNINTIRIFQVSSCTDTDVYVPTVQY